MSGYVRGWGFGRYNEYDRYNYDNIYNRYSSSYDRYSSYYPSSNVGLYGRSLYDRSLYDRSRSIYGKYYDSWKKYDPCCGKIDGCSCGCKRW